ncbi:MAG: transglycosylase SLT domain-containing protein, partial [Rhizobiales bacterium]|nr:transglycosylase SLT domain-containing protein [Rhizobacter sp.]
MTHSLHGRLGRFLSSRVPLLLSTLALPIVLLSGCVTPPGTSPSTDPSSQGAPAVDASTAAAPQAAASAALPEPEMAVAPVPIDTLRPEVRLDLDDRAAQTDLWMRVRQGFTMPDLDTDLVRNREQWYATRPDYVQRMTERGSRYLFHIVEELDRRGMPTELALLPFIESAFNPQAISSARASGMWQFMAATGKDFSLKQNIFRDDRRDVLQSTRAALDYMQKLYAMFGDWHLALAAYNWGEGSVQRAIARNQKLGLPTDYTSLKMPNETQYYVPKLQAVKNIIARPADFGLTLPPLKNHPYFLSVPIERDMDVAVAVRLAGMPLEEFQYLNPQMNKPVILAAGTPQVLLPYDNANLFVRELPVHRGPLASWTAWVVPTTMRTAEAARQVGMTEPQLREVNRIPPRMLVKAGSTLLVPRGERRQADVSLEIADNATMALAPDAPPLRKVSLKAGRKDSVATVAKRYRVSATQVAQWNGVGSGASFKPGQTIVVYVANKGMKSVPAKATTRTAARGTAKPSGPPSTRTTAVKPRTQ